MMEDRNLANEGADDPITFVENADNNVTPEENKENNESVGADIINQGEQDDKSESTAIAPLILGIVSLVFGCVPLIGLITGVLAFVMSGSNMQAKYAFVARILGTLGIVLSVVLILLQVRRRVFF